MPQVDLGDWRWTECERRDWSSIRVFMLVDGLASRQSNTSGLTPRMISCLRLTDISQCPVKLWRIRLGKCAYENCDSEQRKSSETSSTSAIFMRPYCETGHCRWNYSRRLWLGSYHFS